MNHFNLKLIAVISMLVDHTGAVLFPQYSILRLIGRVAFPIFCFMIAKGAQYTSNLPKYLLRLGIFAIISEIPFNLMISGKIFDINGQNVYFTLFLGLTAIAAVKYLKKWYFIVPAIACTLIAAHLLKTDYGWYGVIMILALYLAGENKLLKALAIIIPTEIYCVNTWIQVRSYNQDVEFSMVFNLLQQFCILAVIPIFLYNSKKGYNSKWLQIAFYAFYPVHMIVLCLINIYS